MTTPKNTEASELSDAEHAEFEQWLTELAAALQWSAYASPDGLRIRKNMTMVEFFRKHRAAIEMQASHSAAADAVPVAWPQGFAVKHVDGHGWIVEPEGRLPWVAFDGTPVCDLLTALRATAPAPAATTPAASEDDCTAASIELAAMILSDCGYACPSPTTNTLARRIASRVCAHTAAQVAASKPAVYWHGELLTTERMIEVITEQSSKAWDDGFAEGSKPAAASGEDWRERLHGLVDTYFNNNCGENVYNRMASARTALAATPPSQEPALPATGEALTDEQITKLYTKATGSSLRSHEEHMAFGFARVIESAIIAALKGA